MEEHPGEQRSHERAVEEVDGEADFAEPEEDRLGEEAAEMRREDNGESQELGTERRPETAEFVSQWQVTLAKLEQGIRPRGVVGSVHGVGHECESDSRKDWRNEKRVPRKFGRPRREGEFGKNDSAEDVHPNKSWTVGQSNILAPGRFSLRSPNL